MKTTTNKSAFISALIFRINFALIDICLFINKGLFISGTMCLLALVIIASLTYLPFFHLGNVIIWTGASYLFGNVGEKLSDNLFQHLRYHTIRRFY